LSARGPDTARAARTVSAVAAKRHDPSYRVQRPAVATTGPRHNVPEAQRARVLAATVSSIAEVGYAQLSVTNVVALARVSRATFYDLFSDREDVFLAAFDEAVAQIEAVAAEAYASGGTWEQRVRAGLETVLDVFDEEPALARLCVMESQQAGPRMLGRRAEIVERLARIVDEGSGGQRRRGADSGQGRSGAAPPPLTAQSLVAGVLWVLHERLLSGAPGPLSELVGPLMSMIVFPYRDPAAAAAELRRPPRKLRRPRDGDVGRERRVALEGMGNRLTYRTLRALAFVAEHQGANNREVADGVGISDKGQISKLLVRLASLGLIENTVDTRRKGVANAWRITAKGQQLRRAVKA
jgi:AcrR family transcriptional regulator/DNA-binding MarR family transcriptional regulator